MNGININFSKKVILIIYIKYLSNWDVGKVSLNIIVKDLLKIKYLIIYISKRIN